METAYCKMQENFEIKRRILQVPSQAFIMHVSDDEMEGTGSSDGDSFVMRVTDYEMEDTDGSDGESYNRSLTSGRQFSFADLDLSDYGSSEDELDQEIVEACLVDKTGLVAGSLFKVEREYQHGLREFFNQKENRASSKPFIMCISNEEMEGTGSSYEDIFVMHTRDDEMEDTDSNDGESYNQSFITGRRFSFADLDLRVRVKWELSCSKNFDQVSPNTDQEWSLDGLILELKPLKIKLGECFQAPTTLRRTKCCEFCNQKENRASSKPFVMRISYEEMEVTGSSDGDSFVMRVRDDEKEDTESSDGEGCT